MASSVRRRSMPLVFEVRDGRKSKYILYDQVLKDRACGQRVIRQALDELDAWRKQFGRLFESLEFTSWRDLIALLDQLRGDRPPRSPAHTRARKDPRYAQEKFHEAMGKIDAWQRTYGYLFERLKHAAGRRMAQAVENVCHPPGRHVFYVWNAEKNHEPEP